MMSECILMPVNVCVREKIHAVVVFLCLFGGGGKGMMCVFVSVSLH